MQRIVLFTLTLSTFVVLAVANAAAQPQMLEDYIWPTGHVDIQLDGGVATIASEHTPEDAAEESARFDRLLVVTDRGPLGWFELAPDGRTYRRVVGPVALEVLDNARGWAVADDIVAGVGDRWPAAIPIRAALETVGPGARTAWLRAGSIYGVGRGDCWWARTAGQPVARFDVLDVTPQLAFGRLVPLAANVDLREGVVFESWARRAKRVGRSGVCAIGSDSLIWIALPRDFVPRELRVVLERAGKPIGRGVLERTDARFGYVRPSPATAAAAVRVGDAARLEAPGIGARRGVRTFVQEDGARLIDAGELDGVRRGQRASVLAGGEVVGQIVVTRVQPAYAGVAWSGQRPAAPVPPVARVVFEAPARPRALAVVDAVVDGSVFVATVGGAPCPVGTVLAIDHASELIGAAMVVEVAAGRAIGFAIRRAQQQPPRVGDVLRLP